MAIDKAISYRQQAAFGGIMGRDGRRMYGGGSDMGSVADSKGNVGPGTGGYQGGPQGGYGDAGNKNNPSGDDYARSRREYQQAVNHAAAIEAAKKEKRKAKNKNITKFGYAKPKSKLGGILGTIAGMMLGIPGLGLLTGGFDKLKGGLGSLNETLGDFREKTTGFRTQAEYDAARQQRQLQGRLDNMYDRKSKGKNFSQKNMDMLESMGLQPSTAQNVLTGRDLKGFTESRGLQTPQTFSDPFANTVGTTTKVNAPSNDAVSSVTRDYSGIEDYGVDINPQGSKSIFESLFPQGNLQDIIKNSKTQKDYNINATKDLVENLPGGVVKEAIAPALAGVLSPFYDGIQGIYRGATNPNKSILQALKDENIGSSMKERFTGAAAPLAERIANLNLSNPFISSAAAAEISPAIGMQNTVLGSSVPTGDVGLKASGKLGNLTATIDAIDALKGESVNPQINYSGNFGNTTAYGNFSDNARNIGLNFSNDKGLSGGISYDAITGEPRFDIGFRRTFADGGIASMFTRRG